MATTEGCTHIFLDNFRSRPTPGKLNDLLASRGGLTNFLKVVHRGGDAGSDFAFVGFQDEAAYDEIFVYTMKKFEICADGRGLVVNYNSSSGRQKPT